MVIKAILQSAQSEPDEADKFCFHRSSVSNVIFALTTRCHRECHSVETRRCVTQQPRYLEFNDGSSARIYGVSQDHEAGCITGYLAFILANAVRFGARQEHV